jgi:hypothetical protein
MDDGWSPAMTTVANCPACDGASGRLLPFPSELSCADYYRCSKCGHVWTVNKERPDLIHNVTALPDKLHAPSLK